MSQQAPTYDDPVDPVDPVDPIEEESMTLMEHLHELRGRLMWIGGSIIIMTLISMVFVTPIIELIIAPLGERPQAIGPTDTIGIFFKVSFSACIFSLLRQIYILI